MTQRIHRMGRRYAWLASGFLSLAGAPELAASTGGPQAETEALVAAYRSCCPASGKADKSACHAVDRFFDYAALARSTVAPLGKKLKPLQRKRLVGALEDIFVRTARQSGTALCAATPRILAAKPHAQGSEVALEVLEPGEDVPTRLAFVWRQDKQRWQVIDLELEGGSLVTDYQNQFSRIEHKEGAEGLLRRVEARRSAADELPKGTETESSG